MDRKMKWLYDRNKDMVETNYHADMRKILLSAEMIDKNQAKHFDQA